MLLRELNKLVAVANATSTMYSRKVTIDAIPMMMDSQNERDFIDEGWRSGMIYVRGSLLKEFGDAIEKNQV